MKHVRAVLVLLHVLAITLLSFPAPVGAMSKRAFAAPATQATFQSYADALQGMGFDVRKDQLEAWLWEWGNAFLAARNKVVAPFIPYAELTGSEQGWRMFGGLNRHPAWLVVEVQQDGQWRTVYRMRSPDLDWRRRQFDQERMRALANSWSWGSRKGTYDAFSVWLAQRAAEDFPTASHMRIHMEKVTLPPPEQLRAEGMPPGKPFWESKYSLDKYR